jgi:hypothetical protein
MTTEQMTTGQTFGQRHFGRARLGDQRRVKRLIALANQLASHPGGTLPHKVKSPKDLKALYRLCQCPTVTHEAVLAPHREHVLSLIEQHQGTLLVIHDATELDYTMAKSLGTLSHIGNGSGRGYICQNSLVVDPKTRLALGLFNQVLHDRAHVPKHETREQARQRESRESRLWMRGTAGLPADARLVDVCDSGADTFEFLEHEMRSGRRFAIRAYNDRALLTGHAEPGAAKCRLFSYLREQSSLGERTLEIQPTATRPGRRATLHYAAAPVRLLPPGQPRGQHGDQPLAMWCVRIWEIDPPPEVEEPAEWFLLTNEPVAGLDDARRVGGWYETRWVVEEFHKAQKTGCAIEQLQFRHLDRLQPAIALISIIALTLLNLRDASRREDAKTQPATTLFAAEYVEVLSRWRWQQVRPDVTIHDFFYALARLGGHQNRKHDHPPGWLILWRGWTTLQAMVDGASTARKKCG